MILPGLSYSGLDKKLAYHANCLFSSIFNNQNAIVHYSSHEAFYLYRSALYNLDKTHKITSCAANLDMEHLSDLLNDNTSPPTVLTPTPAALRRHKFRLQGQRRLTKKIFPRETEAFSIPQIQATSFRRRNSSSTDTHLWRSLNDTRRRRFLLKATDQVKNKRATHSSWQGVILVKGKSIFRTDKLIKTRYVNFITLRQTVCSELLSSGTANCRKILPCVIDDTYI